MYELPVQNIHFYTSDIFELTLERGGYDFVPGQCAVLFDAPGDSRPYSIASGAEEPVLRFLLRRFSGGAVSGWLAERSPGDRVQVTPAFGEFRTGCLAGPVVYVATGVGIAPFLSALRTRSFEPVGVHCVYGVRTAEDAVAMPEFRSDLRLHQAVSRGKSSGHFNGRVTGLLKTLSLPGEADYYLCGCDAMIDDVYDVLEARGVVSGRIHTEVFFTSRKGR